MDRSIRHLAAKLSCLLALLILATATAPASASAAGDPAANRSLSDATQSYCSDNPSGTACVDAALADINAAHAAEGVRPMVLPSDFASMSVPIQLLNLANLERVDRGLPAILGLSAALNRDAQTAAEQNRDPMPTHFYGNTATGNWAAGYDNTLEADFAWMYDDGPGADNLDCTSPGQSGCWGHRHDILWHFDTPIAMGAGSAQGQYGPSVTELFVGGDTRTGPGQPDAPVVRPSQPSSSGSGTGSAPTGHAAGTGRAHPKAWAGSVAPVGRALQFSVGCQGTTVCTVHVFLTVAGRPVGGPVVHVAAGHRKMVVIALGRRARRLLNVRRHVRVRIAVRQGGRLLVSRSVLFRLA